MEREEVEKMVKEHDDKLKQVPTKDEMDKCVGDHCEKITRTVGGQIMGLKHTLRDERTVPPSKEAEDQDQPQGHETFEDASKCPNCGPQMKDAAVKNLGLVDPATIKQPEAFKLSEEQRQQLVEKGIPTCDKCGVPWLAEVDKCENCGTPA